jgi:hypothetical protein
MIKTHLAVTGVDRSFKRSHPQMIQIPDTHVTVKPDNRKDRKIDISIKISSYNLKKFVYWV